MREEVTIQQFCEWLWRLEGKELMKVSKKTDMKDENWQLNVHVREYYR